MGFFYVLTLTKLLIFGFGNLIDLYSCFSSSEDLFAWSGTNEEEEETKDDIAVRPRAAIFFSSQKGLKIKKIKKMWRLALSCQYENLRAFLIPTISKGIFPVKSTIFYILFEM